MCPEAPLCPSNQLAWKCHPARVSGPATGELRKVCMDVWLEPPVMVRFQPLSSLSQKVENAMKCIISKLIFLA